MGLFDYVTCGMTLPECPDWMHEFQSKDTPAQWMEQYAIRDDGTLWHEEYDVENHSDPNAEGLMALAGSMSRVNRRWVQVEGFDGVVDFYNSNAAGGYCESRLIEPGTGDKYISVDYRVVFVDGRVVKGPVLLAREEQAEHVYTDRHKWDAFVRADQERRRSEGAPTQPAIVSPAALISPAQPDEGSKP